MRKIAQIILLDRFERGLKFEKEDEQKYSQRTLSASWRDEIKNPFNYKNPNWNPTGQKLWIYFYQSKTGTLLKLYT